jgi:hypothetical protein
VDSKYQMGRLSVMFAPGLPQPSSIAPCFKKLSRITANYPSPAILRSIRLAVIDSEPQKLLAEGGVLGCVTALEEPAVTQLGPSLTYHAQSTMSRSAV